MGAFKTIGIIAVTFFALRLVDFLLTLLSKPSDILVGIGAIGLVAIGFAYFYFVRYVLRGKQVA